MTPNAISEQQRNLRNIVEDKLKAKEPTTW